MAIGTAAAIGLGVAGVGSVLSSKSNSKAASTAANVSQQNNAANVALAKQVYGQNQAALAPYMTRGNAAGDQINALLGLGAPANNNIAATNALNAYRGGPSAASAYGLDERGMMYGRLVTNDVDRIQPTFPMAGGMPSAQGGGLPVGTTASGSTVTSAPNQAGAFDTFRNSTGYQFRLGEGMNALNSGYAASGILQSGAAMRAAQEYGQNFASNEFGNYMNLLANQQGVGLSGANALAGVGTNYAGMVTSANNQNAANQANAALYRGQNSFGNTLGMLGGVLTGLGG